MDQNLNSKHSQISIKTNSHLQSSDKDTKASFSENTPKRQNLNKQNNNQNNNNNYKEKNIHLLEQLKKKSDYINSTLQNNTNTNIISNDNQQINSQNKNNNTNNFSNMKNSNTLSKSKTQSNEKNSNSKFIFEDFEENLNKINQNQHKQNKSQPLHTEFDIHFADKISEKNLTSIKGVDETFSQPNISQDQVYQQQIKNSNEKQKSLKKYQNNNKNQFQNSNIDNVDQIVNNFNIDSSFTDNNNVINNKNNNQGIVDDEKERLLNLLQEQMKVNQNYEELIKNKDFDIQHLQEKVVKLSKKEELNNQTIQKQNQQISEFQKKCENFQKEILNLQRELTKQEGNFNKVLEEKENFYDLYTQEKSINQELQQALDYEQENNKLLNQQQQQLDQQLQQQQQQQKQNQHQLQQQQQLYNTQNNNNQQNCENQHQQSTQQSQSSQSQIQQQPQQQQQQQQQQQFQQNSQNFQQITENFLNNNNIYCDEFNIQNEFQKSQSDQLPQNSQKQESIYNKNTKNGGLQDPQDGGAECLRKIILELVEVLQVESLDEIILNVQEIQNQNKQNNKFIRSVTDLTIKCSPQGYFKEDTPSIRQVWKFIKKVVEEYITLKQCTGGEKEIIQLVIKYLEIENNKEIIPEIYKIQQNNKNLGQLVGLFKKVLKLDENQFKNDNDLKKYLESEIDTRKSSIGGFSQSNFTNNN